MGSFGIRALAVTFSLLMVVSAASAPVQVQAQFPASHDTRETTDTVRDHASGDTGPPKSGGKDSDEQPANADGPPDNGNDDPGSGNDDPGNGEDNLGKGEDDPGKGNGEDYPGNGNGPPSDGPPGDGNQSDGGQKGKCDRSDRGPPEHAGSNESGAPEHAGPLKCEVDRSEALPSVNESRPALELQIEAWRLLNESGNESTAPGNSTLSPAERAELQDELEQSFAYFVGVNRTADIAYFDRTREVAAKTGKRRPNVSAHLAVASGTVAHTATRDAEQAYEDLQRRNATFDEAAVQSHIRKANRALQQAEHVRQQSANPVAAVTHYRRAWNHAQAALDIMDADTRPEVTLTRRADPVRNGSANYTVAGTVYDVRPWTIENATVDVDGETTTVPVRVTNASPSETARFAARVRLPSQVTNVTVTATDSGTPTSTLVDEYEPNDGTAAVRLDGDGLPDTYELSETETNPLGPDSISTGTPTNEADNGTVDGREDFDGDRLPSMTERQLETDPLVADTDEDGLRDGYEIVVLELDPLEDDTDEDGTLDGREDPDGDGLTNVREQGLDTDPTHNDTDRDGLEDPAELDRGTEPTVADTDDDNLVDGDELQDPFDTDPLDPDTDEDGILDGNETYTTTVADNGTGAEVTVTAPGDAVLDAHVGPEQQAGFDNDVLDSLQTSHVVELTAPELSSGTVRLAYNESAVGNESDLAVFRYNEQTGLFELLPSTVFPEANVVAAETTEPGVFVVMERSDRAADLKERGDQPLNTVNKTSFEVDQSNCSGICQTDGGSITIGVTSAGKGEIPGLDTASALNTAERSTITRFESGSKQREEDRTSDDGNITDEISVHAPDVQVNRTVTNTSVIFTIEGLNATSSGDDTNGTVSTQDIISPGPGDDADEDLLMSFDTAGASKVNLSYDVTVAANVNASYMELFVGGTYGNRTLASVYCTQSETCPDTEVTSGTTNVGSLVEDELNVKARKSGNTNVTFNEPLEVEIVYDHDADGVPDPDDLCADTIGTGENGCPDSTYEVATLSFDKPVDRVQINVSGWGYVGTEGSSVELSVEEGSGETHSPYTREKPTGNGDPDSFTKDREYTDVGTELTLRLSAEGTAALNLQSLQIKVDTDDDGLWNTQEKKNTFTTDRYGAVDTAYDDVDTDGDNLSDPKEMSESTKTLYTGFGYVTTWHPISNATNPDTDGDTLVDGEEYWGWEIDVVNSTCSNDPCRYDAENVTGDAQMMDVTSLPNETDTDGDSLNDSVERNRTHTDPRQEITYNITRIHQTEIIDEYENSFSQTCGFLLERIGVPEQVRFRPLNDSSDDFDFVRSDSGSLVFTALDGTERTDTWLSNTEEVAYNPKEEQESQKLDPWDPDYDDDGLTDGQELKFVTTTSGDVSSVTTDRFTSQFLNSVSPVTPDSDDDGWWDGWIGVYNASYNSWNVILYMEHLRDEDMGIQTDEIVQAQVKVHNETVAPIPDGRGADIDGDNEIEHSNVHLGELQWETDPSSGGNNPDEQTQFTLEVDFYETSGPQKLNNPNWTEGIEDNYALYGIEVGVIRNETLTKSQLSNLCHVVTTSYICVTPDNGFEFSEIIATSDKYANRPSNEYLFVVDERGSDVKFLEAGAWNNPFGPQQAIWTNPLQNRAGTVPSSAVRDSVYNSKLEVWTAESELHEIGHTFGAGESDDAVKSFTTIQRAGEVYSGDDDPGEKDPTPERLGPSTRQINEWSIMIAGWEDQLVFRTDGRVYFVFSIEELSTFKR